MARSARAVLLATATAATYLGSATRLDLVTRDGTALSVSVPNEVAASARAGGGPVWLTWPSDKGFLLAG